MLRGEDYPYLNELLGGYFHQDAFDSAGSVEEIIADFKTSSWDYQRLGVRADIRRLIHQHADGLLDLVQQAFSPQVIIGRNDAEARAWLLQIEAALADG